MSLPLPDDATEPQLAATYAAARRREGRVMAILRRAQVYDAVAVVGLLNLANRAALATGITPEDDLP